MKILERKELSIEEKSKAYDKAIGIAKLCLKDGTITNTAISYIETIFPELKESEDKKWRKWLIGHLEGYINQTDDKYAEVCKKAIDWLEKQGEANEIVNRDKFAKGVLKGAAINLISWIDYNVAEDNMCLSNMESEYIKDSLVSGDWDRIYACIKRKLEKQGEHNLAWSEEDEKHVDSLLKRLEGLCRNEFERTRFAINEDVDWLKSLKERMGE